MAKREKKAKPAKNGASKSVIDRGKYGDAYEKRDEKTASGKRYCIDNGDDVAAALRGKTVEECLDIAELNGATKEQLSKWRDKNPGMARMNVGNMLRGIARKGGSIKVSARKSVETKEVGGATA